ncbi:ribokinase [Pseudactinotalea sp.]|uniref:ribokinase n=1 Tax=Pseudactinotalea sp. TaxID=1926260 RepID=UPI003B3A6949
MEPADVPTVLVVGSVNQDLVLEVPGLPSTGDTVLALRGEWSQGGKGGNQAVAVAAAGVRSVLCGAVGDDAWADGLVAGLRESGVGTGGLVHVSGSTGFAAVVVDRAGDNAIVVLPGANDALTPERVKDRVGDLEEFDLVLLQAEIPVPTIRWVLRRAHHAGLPTVLNLAPVVEIPRADLALASVVVVNEHEAAELLAQLSQPSQASPLTMAVQLSETLGNAVIVTRGAEGAVLADGRLVHELDGIPVAEVVDSTGAGDAFVGTLGASLARDGDLRQAMRDANEAGARAVTHVGARAALPSAELHALA